MGLELNRVHIYERGPANTVLMKGINPATRIRFDRETPPVFIQGGRFFGEGGVELPRKSLPEAFWAEAKRLTVEARRECGLVLPEEEEKSPGASQRAMKAGTKKMRVPEGLRLCPVCHTGVKQGAEWASHVRKHKKAGELEE